MTESIQEVISITKSKKENEKTFEASQLKDMYNTTIL